MCPCVCVCECLYVLLQILLLANQKRAHILHLPYAPPSVIDLQCVCVECSWLCPKMPELRRRVRACVHGSRNERMHTVHGGIINNEFSTPVPKTMTVVDAVAHTRIIGPQHAGNLPS